MNLRTALRARHRLDEAELQALVETAEAALRARGVALPKASGDLFERADALAAVVPDDATTPTASTPSAGSGLVAEYEKVKGDPIARARFFEQHGAEVVRAIDADRTATETARRASEGKDVPHGPALLAEYERVKGDPKARAEFLAKHDRELAQLMN